MTNKFWVEAVNSPNLELSEIFLNKEALVKFKNSIALFKMNNPHWWLPKRITIIFGSIGFYVNELRKFSEDIADDKIVFLGSAVNDDIEFLLHELNKAISDFINGKTSELGKYEPYYATGEMIEAYLKENTNFHKNKDQIIDFVKEHILIKD